MINFVTYRENNGMGEIIQSGTCQQIEMQSQRPFMTDEVMEGVADDFLHYIPDLNTPVITLKPISPVVADKLSVTADGVDKITLSSVPNGAMIQLINKGNLSVTEGVGDGTNVELMFDSPGAYQLKIKSFPYLDYEIMINAN